VNQIRADNGLPPLTPEEDAALIAAEDADG
jgi:hypothetical protein